MHQRNQQRTKNNRVVQKCTKTLLYQNMRYNSCKKHLLRQVLFCNEINPLRDLWNLLCKWNTPAACEMPAGVRGLISFHFPRRRKISQAPRRLFHILRQQNISPKLFPSVRIYLSKTQIHLFRTPLTKNGDKIDVSCEKPDYIGLLCYPNSDFSLYWNADKKTPFSLWDRTWIPEMWISDTQADRNQKTICLFYYPQKGENRYATERISQTVQGSVWHLEVQQRMVGGVFGWHSPLLDKIQQSRRFLIQADNKIDGYSNIPYALQQEYCQMIVSAELELGL